MHIAGAIFDLDGVLTNTAALHERAWREVTGCTSAEYMAHFDGRKRMDGLRRYFSARGDQANEPYLEHLCERKDAVYRAMIETEGVSVYGDVRTLMAFLSCPMAVASSSQNAKAVIRASGLAERFHVVMDGYGADKPQSFIRAAEAMGVAFSDCVVFEDSPEALMAAIGAGVKYAVYVRKDRE